jgi:hypothetical protein
MNLAIHVLDVVAIMTTAVVYGTDVFCSIVQRPALAHVDDASLTAVMGRVHDYGDRRMPIPGIAGLAATIAITVLAAITGQPAPTVLTAIAAVALLAWLVIYTKISAPVNKQLTDAAKHHRSAPEARSLQHRWDSVITTRALLQGTALAALCIALAT